MGCRCRERTDVLHRARQAMVRGDAATVARAAGFVARTFAEDVRSGAVRQAATARLNQLKARLVRR